jgi:nucleotide-binding universal stress UspA family protein
MEDIKKILVVSRMTRYCEKAVHYGVSLAKKYGAALSVVHVMHDPFGIEGWNLPLPNLEKDYQNLLKKSRQQLDDIIAAENKGGMHIDVLIREGEPTTEILTVVSEKKIDLLVMLAHEEGRLEHFLFGRSNEALIRKMPCSILLVKKEPGPAAF